MAQARDEAGNIWEVDAQGNPVRLIQAAGGGSSQPEVIELPRTQRDIDQLNRDDRKYGDTREDRTFDNAAKLRNEFRGLPTVKDYQVALGTYNSALTTQPTAEGDQSLIVSFARMLDPNSVVREGEFAMAASNEAAFNRILNDVKRQFGVDGAGRLSDQGRSRLREEMRNLVVNRFKVPYERDRQEFQQFAQMEGIDPFKVIGTPPEQAFPQGFLEPIENANAPLAAPDATTEGVAVPQEYQDGLAAYIQQNWGQIDPQAYTEYRSQLDQRFGYDSNPATYSADAARFNDLAARGAPAGAVGSIPPVEREMGPVDQFLNSAAQSPFGAATASYANSATAGVPGILAGSEGKLNRIRDLNPASAFAGELAGGVTGTLATGGALKAGASLLGGSPRLAALLANPMTTEVGYGAAYGAAEGGAEGAAAGAAGGVLGAKGGEVLGRLFPDTFASGSMDAARDSVPSIQQLKDKAAGQYAAVEATGQIADPQATADMFQRASQVLAREGRISPAGRMIDTDTPTTRAMTLLEDYAGQPMTPTQAGTVRNVLSEGLMGKDASQRRISGMLLDEFDQWADPVLPGISVPRETASRYLQGQKIDEAIQLAGAEKSRLTQSGYENALRGQFRNLDRSVIRGNNRFDGAVTDAIENVGRGDALSNTARNIGKFAPTSPMSMAVGGGAVGMLGNMAGGPAVGIPLGLLAAGAGSASRTLATNRAEQSAANALNTALGGPQYQAMLAQAAEEAALTGRRIGGGLFGAGGVAANRQRR